MENTNDITEQDQGQQIDIDRSDAEAGGNGQAQQQSGSNVATAGRGQMQSDTRVLMPPVDVIEDVSGITLLADMPGVARDDLTLRLDARSLTIEGGLSIDLPQELASNADEIRRQRYRRTFALSRELDAEQASAELKHGVLRVRIPKTQQAVPRKIPVNVA